jgi:hypothetical protein
VATTPIHTLANPGRRTERTRNIPVAPWQTVRNPPGKLPRKIYSGRLRGEGRGDSPVRIIVVASQIQNRWFLGILIGETNEKRK